MHNVVWSTRTKIKEILSYVFRTCFQSYNSTNHKMFLFFIFANFFADTVCSIFYVGHENTI